MLLDCFWGFRSCSNAGGKVMDLIVVSSLVTSVWATCLFILSEKFHSCFREMHHNCQEDTQPGNTVLPMDIRCESLAFLLFLLVPPPFSIISPNLNSSLGLERNEENSLGSFKRKKKRNVMMCAVWLLPKVVLEYSDRTTPELRILIPPQSHPCCVTESVPCALWAVLWTNLQRFFFLFWVNWVYLKFRRQLKCCI